MTQPFSLEQNGKQEKKQVRMRKNLELFFIEIRVEGLENHDCYIMVPHHLENRPAGWSVPHRIPLLGISNYTCIHHISLCLYLKVHILHLCI